jgi:DUF4097 and DUF4098 domain-containing protein YvlB
MLKQFAKFGILMVLLTPALIAQQNRVYSDNGGWVREANGTVAASRNLSVAVDFGAVRVEGGPQSDVSYTFHGRYSTSSEEKGRRSLDAYKISAFVRGDTTYVTADWQGRGEPNWCTGEFVINVPRNVELAKVETKGGSVSVAHLNGRLEAESGGGRIHLEDISGAVRAGTGGDNIEVESVGGDLDLQTGGGKVRVGSVKGRISASTGGGDVVLVSSDQGAVLESGGGNIQVKQCGGALKISTGGGNIDVGSVGGPAEIDTGGGSIRLGWAKGMVRAETGAGRIELDGVPAAQAESGAGTIVARFVGSGEHTDSKLETGSGDITVYLAPDVHFTIRASIEIANGHKIYSEFPELKVQTEGEWGAQTSVAEGSLNGGGPLLKVHTATGNVWIKHAQ